MSRSRAAYGAAVAVGIVLCLAAWRSGRIEAASTGDPGAGLPVIASLSHDGQIVAYFSNVEGLAPTVAGTGQSTAKSIREAHLTRGFTTSRAVWDWRLAYLEGGAAKGEVTIAFYDATLQEIASWRLDRAYPAAVSDSMVNGVATEELVLAYEGLTMTKP